MTAKSVLNSSVCVSTMLNNVPVVLTGIQMGNVSLLRAMAWTMNESFAPFKPLVSLHLER